MRTESLEYGREAPRFKGYLAYPQGKGPHPAILIVHSWRGLTDFEKEKACLLAEMGYLAFAVDLYGNGTVATDDSHALELMTPLFLDRSTLRERVLEAFNEIAQNPLVNPKKIGAIGFCFGGLSVIELLRSGVAVKGVVSFHGAFGSHLGEQIAKTVPLASKVEGAILILHGYDDPLVPQHDIQQLQEELTTAQVDWQMNIYGNTSHAFTNPLANNPAGGLVYNPVVAKRAWLAMQQFFSEITKDH